MTQIQTEAAPASVLAPPTLTLRSSGARDPRQETPRRGMRPLEAIEDIAWLLVLVVLLPVLMLALWVGVGVLVVQHLYRWARRLVAPTS